MFYIVARLTIVFFAAGCSFTIGASWASVRSGASTITGTVVLSGGYLTISPPPPLTWDAPLTGSTQYVVDNSSNGEGYVVNNATGTGVGWNVTVAVSPFACTGGGCAGHQLPQQGTLTTNGSVSSPVSPSQPSQTCTTGASCVLPQNQLAYPIDVPTGGAPTKIFDSAIHAGMGSIDIGGANMPNPVGWWLTIGEDVQAGSYTSLMAVAVNAGP